jgi:pilus assembly protein CpaE
MQMSVPAAIISTDSGFREALTRTLAGARRPIAVAAEISVPFAEIAEDELRRLRTAKPVLVVIDLEKDPALGVRLAHFLSDAHPEMRILAAGPAPSPELLMNAMRAGISEYLPKPVTPESLAEVLERVDRKLGRAEGGREPGQLLAFFSAKGGSGSTTVATNLAIHLQHLTDKSVLLADLDLELGEIALFMGVHPRFNFVDLVKNFHRMDAELLASYIERHESGVHLLSAPFQPEKVDAASPDQIRRIFQFLKQQYDYVLVDTPKSFTPAAMVALEQADAIYVVTVVDLPSLRNIKRSLPLLERLTNGRVKERVKLVVNRYHPDNAISIDELESTLGMEVHWKLSNDYDSVLHAMNSGEPIMLNGRGSPFAADLRALGAEITGLQAADSRPGRLARLRRILGSRGD